jgi:hypothetical protein
MHLTPHDGTGGARDLDRAVARVVVVDVNEGPRQRSAEIGNHFGNSCFLVEARHQYCQALACMELPAFTPDLHLAT